jgi:hypothetical protein
MLVAVIALRAPAGGDQAVEFAARAGSWIGPLGGGLAALLMAWWAGRRVTRPVLQGGIIGTALALMDFAILIALGTAFQWLFVFSNVGKVVAATIGGALAMRAQEHRTARAGG